MPKGFHCGRLQTRHYTTEYHRINASSFKCLLDLPLGSYSLSKEGVSAEHCKFTLIESSRWLRVMLFSINGKELRVPLQTDNRSASSKTYIVCPYCVKQRQHLYATRSTYACRKCLNLHYASQSERKPDRLARNIRKQRIALWGHDFPFSHNLLESCMWWPKPKWIRWKTFEEKRNNIAEMEKQYWKLSMAMFDGALVKEFGYLLDFD